VLAFIITIGVTNMFLKDNLGATFVIGFVFLIFWHVKIATIKHKENE
jgi:hypothetical protein